MPTDREFSRSFGISALKQDGFAFSVQAEGAELAAVARRLDLVDLDRLTARGHVRPGPRRAITIVQGMLEAECRQSCVVTLEPVPATLVVPFERYFVHGGEPDDGEVEVGIEDEEPEPLQGGMLDVGEIVVEELSLALDPYPHAAGADEAMKRLCAQEDELKDKPFSALAALRRRERPRD